MQALDAEVKLKGLCFLNECGVDPGLDHMSTMKMIHSIPEGGKLRRITQIGGGLPAPIDNDNPFGYKLSWSPRGMLMASNNPARLKKNGEIVQVVGEDLLNEEHLYDDYVDGIGDLEWFYNRDSVVYSDIYGIPETETIIRGTYRYLGWCRTMNALKSLGFTSLKEDLEFQKLENSPAVNYSRYILNVDGDQDLKTTIASKLNISSDDSILHKFEWVGMFDSELKVPKVKSALDFMCWLFQRKLVYQKGEKDMFVMRLTFEVRFFFRIFPLKCSYVEIRLNILEAIV
jgi:saccharopine dehydrogenase (NADP+, L-glutamate forming)/spermidine synthase